MSGLPPNDRRGQVAARNGADQQASAGRRRWPVPDRRSLPGENAPRGSSLAACPHVMQLTIAEIGSPLPGIGGPADARSRRLGAWCRRTIRRFLFRVWIAAPAACKLLGYLEDEGVAGHAIREHRGPRPANSYTALESLTCSPRG